MSNEPKNRVAPYAPSIPHEFTRKGRAMQGSAFLRNVGLVACAAVLCAVTAMADDPPPPPSFDGTKAGQVRDDNGLKMKLVWCPPGEFAMGSREEEKQLPGGTDPLVKGGQATDLPASPASKSASPGGAARVFRGGNWFSDAGFCRSAARGKRTPGFRLFNLGFRVALERSVK